MNIIDRLGMWITQQTYKGWNSAESFKIISISNPGWMIVANLKNTALEAKNNFHEGNVLSKNDWYLVTIKNDYFRASGDPSKLFLLLERFTKLSAEAEGYDTPTNSFLPTSFQKLVEWYTERCEQQWHLEYAIKIMSSELPGWQVEIDLQKTGLKDIPQKYQYLAPNSESWCGWEVKNRQFLGRSSAQNLTSLIEVFLTTVDAMDEVKVLT